MYVDNEHPRGRIPCAVGQRRQNAGHRSGLPGPGSSDDSAMPSDECVQVNQRRDRLSGGQMTNLDIARVLGSSVDRPEILFGHQVRRVSHGGMLRNPPLEVFVWPHLTHKLNRDPSIVPRQLRHRPLRHRACPDLRHYPVKIHEPHREPNKSPKLTDSIALTIYEAQARCGGVIQSDANRRTGYVLDSSKKRGIGIHGVAPASPMGDAVAGEKDARKRPKMSKSPRWNSIAISSPSTSSLSDAEQSLLEH